MFCEVAAYAKTKGVAVTRLLDEVYSEFGYFEEKNRAMTFEGAAGAETIRRLLASYVSRSPDEMNGSRVVATRNFETETLRDVEGDEIPKEKMLIFELADRTRIAVRGSGPEPKIKYYLFAQRRPEQSHFKATELSAIKVEVQQGLERIWEWLRKDALDRVAA